MKTQIVVVPHPLVPGYNVIELHYDGRVVGVLTGSDDKPGVQVFSSRRKHCIMHQKKIPGAPELGNVAGVCERAVEVLEVLLLPN